MAVLVTIITLWAIKETIFIFTTSQPDIVEKGNQLKLASLSITIPLMFVCFLLWRPKPKDEEQ